MIKRVTEINLTRLLLWLSKINKNCKLKEKRLLCRVVRLSNPLIEYFFDHIYQINRHWLRSQQLFLHNKIPRITEFGNLSSSNIFRLENLRDYGNISLLRKLYSRGTLKLSLQFNIFQILYIFKECRQMINF